MNANLFINLLKKTNTKLYRRYQQSKSWEVIFLDNNFWGFFALEVLVVIVMMLVSLFWNWLGAESQKSRVTQVQLNLGVVVLKNVLLDGFLLSLVFFGFDKSQLLLLKPFSIDLTLDWNLLLSNGIDVDTFALIVLSKSGLLWLFRLHFLSWNFFNWLSCWGWSLSFRFFILFLVKLILSITNIAKSSSFLSWSVWSSSSTSSIKWMSSWNSLRRSVTISSSITLIVWLFSFFRNISIDNNILSGSLLLWNLLLEFSSFFMSFIINNHVLFLVLSVLA